VLVRLQEKLISVDLFSAKLRLIGLPHDDKEHIAAKLSAPDGGDHFHLDRQIEAGSHSVIWLVLSDLNIISSPGPDSYAGSTECGRRIRLDFKTAKHVADCVCARHTLDLMRTAMWWQVWIGMESWMGRPWSLSHPPRMTHRYAAVGPCPLQLYLLYNLAPGKRTQ
jgi:hypothetical protein